MPKCKQMRWFVQKEKPLLRKVRTFAIEPAVGVYVTLLYSEFSISVFQIADWSKPYHVSVHETPFFTACIGERATCEQLNNYPRPAVRGY